jgi:site-specific DNA-methyltransferase (adenine-specific)
VEVFEAMLAGSAEPGYLVCDPFVGSGASAIAALRRGCRFVGADVSEAAIAFAQARIDQFLATGQDPAQAPQAERPGFLGGASAGAP